MTDKYDVLFNLTNDGDKVETYTRKGFLNTFYNLTGDSKYTSDYGNTETLTELVNSSKVLLRRIMDEKDNILIGL